jgi:hypothetical protein
MECGTGVAYMCCPTFYCDTCICDEVHALFGEFSLFRPNLNRIYIYIYQPMTPEH